METQKKKTTVLAGAARIVPGPVTLQDRSSTHAQQLIRRLTCAGKQLAAEEEELLRTLGHQLAMHAVAARPRYFMLLLRSLLACRKHDADNLINCHGIMAASEQESVDLTRPVFAAS